jgi:hypothetical protein
MTVNLVPSDAITQELLIDILAKMLRCELASAIPGAISGTVPETSDVDRRDQHRVHSAFELDKGTSQGGQ